MDFTVAEIDGVGRHDNRLLVEPFSLSAPTGKTMFVIGGTEISSLAGNGAINEQVAVIPNGAIVNLRWFEFGGMLRGTTNIQRSKCLLVYQPNGNTTGEVVIDALYANINHVWKPIYHQYAGNGTRRFVLRTINFSSVAGALLDFMPKVVGWY